MSDRRRHLIRRASWAFQSILMLFIGLGVAQAQNGARRHAAGTRNAVVVFAQFADDGEPARAPAWSVDIFDADRVGSFTHFYNEMSLDQLEVTGDVMPRRYRSRAAADTYLASSPVERGEIGRFADEILRQADDDIDFTLYDNDGPDGIPNSGDDDGLVDAVFLVLPRTPENFLQGPATGLADLGFDLPWVTDDVGVSGPIEILGGRGVILRGRDFHEAVGTMAHEYGHLLGLRDLYDTDYLARTDNPGPAEDSAGIGAWGLMGWGALGWQRNDGPTALSAWTRAELGWATVDTLRQEVDQIQLQPVAQEGHLYYIPLTDRESYLLEYRTKQSHYDAQIPATGLLIWHLIDVPNRGDKPGYTSVDLECADGRWSGSGYPAGEAVDVERGGDNLDYWSHDQVYAAAHRGNFGDATDPFDGQRFTTFGPDTNPSSRSEQGQASVTVEAIRQQEGVLRATVRASPPAVEIAQLIISDEDDDGIHFAGEILTLSPRLRNVGGLDLIDLQLTLESVDDAIEIVQPQMRFGHLRIGKETFGALEAAGFLQVRFRLDAVGDRAATVQLRARARDFDAIVGELSLDGFSPRLPLSSVTVLDTAGNGDGVAQPGEFVTPLLSFAAHSSENLRKALQRLDLQVVSLDSQHRMIRSRVDLGMEQDSVVTVHGAEVLVGNDATVPLRLEVTSISPYATWKDTIEISVAPGEDQTRPRVSYLRALSYYGELSVELPDEHILEGSQVAGATLLVHDRQDTTLIERIAFERDDGGYLAAWRHAPPGLYLAQAEVVDEHGNKGLSRLQVFSVIDAMSSAQGQSAWEPLAPLPGTNRQYFNGALGAPGSSQVLYATTADALWRSVDQGLSWERTGAQTGTVLGPSSFLVDPVDPFTLHSGNPERVISRDGGQTWRLLRKDVRSVHIDARRSGRLHALSGEERRHWLQSDDFGETWQDVGEVPGGSITPSAADSLVFYSGSPSAYESETGRYVPQPFFHTDDGGQTWHDVTADRPIRRFWSDPHERHGLYGLGGDSLFYSDDAGRSWEARSAVPGDWFNNLFTHAAQEGLLHVAVSSGAFRSTDGGYTWESFGPANRAGLSINAWSLHVDAGNPLQAFLPAYIFGDGPTRQTLLRTLDGGQVWNEMIGPEGSPPTGAIRFLPDGTLLVGSVAHGSDGFHNPAIATTVDGDHWTWDATELVSPGFGPTPQFSDLYIHPEYSDLWFAAFSYSMYRSDDRGQSWHRLAPYPYGDRVRMLIDEQRPGGLWLASDGLWYSEDLGETWAQRSTFHKQVNGGYYIREPKGLILAPDVDVILTAIDSSIWRSRDGGVTWDESFFSFDEAIQILEAPPLDPENLIVVTSSSDVHRSTDGGKSWSQVGELSDIVRLYRSRLRFHPVDQLRMYLVDIFGVFETQDGGTTWQSAGETLPLLMSFRDVVVDPRDGETLYASTAGGVYRLGPGAMTAVLDTTVTTPGRYSLGPNYPNPFNAETLIPYSIAATGQVEIRLYNAAGQLARRLVREELTAGHHVVNWDGRNEAGQIAATGVYFARLVVNGRQHQTRKLLMLR